MAEGVQIAGEALANNVSTDGEGNDRIGLPVTHTSANMVRTKGAFDPRETGSILLCWGKYFDFLL